NKAVWRPLDKEQPREGMSARTFAVPPKGAGWVRVHWRAPPPAADQFQAKDFVAVLWTRAGDTEGREIGLQAHGLFVNDVFLETKDGSDPGSYDCKFDLTETLSQEDEPEITFLVWSSLLDSFDWHKYIHPSTSNPNSTWDDPVKLSKDELDEITNSKK